MIFKLDDKDREAFSYFIDDHNKNTEVISERISMDVHLDIIVQEEEKIFLIGKIIPKE